jgi:hypothetical protein
VTSTAEKTRETRLRRAAKRQGLVLEKSRTRDLRALDYRKYSICLEDAEPFIKRYGTGDASIALSKLIETGMLTGMSLDEVERFLTDKET